MMGITVYSVIISVLFYNLALIAVFLLRRSGAIRAKHTSALLLFLTFLGALRLVTPIDLAQARVVRSYRLLPALQNALALPLLGRLRLGGAFLLLWALGGFLFVLRDVLRQLRFLRADRSLPLTENDRASRIAGEFSQRFRLKISPWVEIPYVTGLFRPVIYVPDLELSDEEWRNIFLHETQHIRAHDEWKKLFFRAIRSLFWWNPLAHLSEREIDLLIELQCDARVAGSGDRDRQEAYLQTMLELMKRKVSDRTPLVASRMVGRQEDMKIRFEALLAHETRRSRRLRAVMPVLMLALFLASYFVIIQPCILPDTEDITSFGGESPAYDLTYSLDASENTYIVLEDGEYHLYMDGVPLASLDEASLSDPQFADIPIIGGK